jgi:hypothetical protein
VLLDVVVVAVAGHLLDHASEQDEPVVAVLPAAAGLELEVPVAVQVDVVGERAELVAVGVEVGAEDVACAAGVR